MVASHPRGFCRLFGKNPVVLPGLLPQKRGMSQLTKKFTIAGALLGAALGFGAMVGAYAKAPGTPGMAELLVQVAIVIVLTGGTALTGCVLGLIVDAVGRKKNDPGQTPTPSA